MSRRPPRASRTYRLFPVTTLFRSHRGMGMSRPIVALFRAKLGSAKRRSMGVKLILMRGVIGEAQSAIGAGLALCLAPAMGAELGKCGHDIPAKIIHAGEVKDHDGIMPGRSNAGQGIPVEISDQ